jgi:hypothetical protein
MQPLWVAAKAALLVTRCEDLLAAAAPQPAFTCGVHKRLHMRPATQPPKSLARGAWQGEAPAAMPGRLSLALPPPVLRHAAHSC